MWCMIDERSYMSLNAKYCECWAEAGTFNVLYCEYWALLRVFDV